jgi:hypothetical protein
VISWQERTLATVWLHEVIVQAALTLPFKGKLSRANGPALYAMLLFGTVMSIQLTPAIEAGLRAEAAARGMEVDALITTAVQVYLRETTAPVHTIRVPSRDRSAEMTWASSPDAQFFGKWVVLEGRQVVASGSNPKQLYEDVRARGLSSPFLIFVSPEEQAPSAGGWID